MPGISLRDITELRGFVCQLIGVHSGIRGRFAVKFISLAIIESV
jgi:hypothetical protein